jgi:hypothetical protein
MLNKFEFENDHIRITAEECPPGIAHIGGDKISFRCVDKSGKRADLVDTSHCEGEFMQAILMMFAQFMDERGVLNLGK